MKETKDVVFCVYDSGLFGLPIARRLARSMKKGYIFSEWEKGFSTINDAIMGSGFEDEGLTRAKSLGKIKEDVDLFVFPDIQHSDIQIELERQGKAVWGSREGDKLEMNREFFLEVLESTKLDVPPYTVVKGVTALGKFLREKTDYYIKISFYRGSFETCHFRSWELDCGLVYGWAQQFGPAGEHIRFLCFPDIATPLEIGGDLYCIDGRWPDRFIHGIEYKDKCYLGSVTAHDDAPKQLRQVTKAFGPILETYKYRNQFSMEVRVKGPKSYFIDPTCRCGLPSSGSQLCLWENFPDIVWYGANGILVQPKASAMYSAEAVLSVKGDPKEEWRIVEPDKSLRDHLHLCRCYKDGNRIIWPSCDTTYYGDEVGWLTVVGDSVEAVVKDLNHTADKLPDGMSACTEYLGYVLKEIQVAQKQGISFGRGPVPDPGLAFKS